MSRYRSTAKSSVGKIRISHHQECVQQNVISIQMTSGAGYQFSTVILSWTAMVSCVPILRLERAAPERSGAYRNEIWRRKIDMASRSIQLTGAIAIVLGTLLAVSHASADTLQISGAGLVRHCPCDFDAADDALVEQGVLKPQTSNGLYFAPVVFPRDGETVCRFTMVYRDVNAADTITAQLLRKRFTNGGSATIAPVVMSTVKSAAGTPNTVRVATDTTIAQPTINTNNSFYFIQVQVPTVNLEILGFQIEVGLTC